MSSVKRVAHDLVSVTLFVMIPSKFLEFVSRLERVAINNVGILVFEFVLDEFVLLSTMPWCVDIEGD